MHHWGFWKLGEHTVQHVLDEGYAVVGVCRFESIGTLDRPSGRIAVFLGGRDGRNVISRAVAEWDAVSPMTAAHTNQEIWP